MYEKQIDKLAKKLADAKEQLQKKLENNEITQEIYDELLDFTFDFEIEDLSCTDKFKKSFEKKKEIKCSSLILEIYNEHKSSFRKAILLSDCLLDPLSYNYTQDKYELTTRILMRALTAAEKEKYPDVLTQELDQLLLLTKILHENNLRNSKMLEDSEFSSFTLSQQIRMICIFLQDQSRLMVEALRTETAGESFITGMEMTVANKKVDYSEDIKVSLVDNYEALLEYYDVLIRYIYYRNRKDLKKEKKFEHGNISPYKLPTFEEVTNIAMQRVYYTKTWSKFKYLEWQLEIRKTKDKVNVFALVPKYKDLYREHIIAGLRRRYIATTNLSNQSSEMMLISQKNIKIIASGINIKDIDSLFHVNKEQYLNAKGIGTLKIETYRKSVKDFYLKTLINDIQVETILLGFEYLFSLAAIYRQSIDNNFSQEKEEDYQYLVPIIEKGKLIEQFAILYNLDNNISTKIIEYFVFTEGMKAEGDIFSKPLIHIGSDKLLFCETLIEQMNIERIIEMLFEEYEVDLAEMGITFEQKIRTILSLSPYLYVNTNKVEFVAYDGKNVEFDFIGIFLDYLLLIECKSMTVPYSDKEVYKCESTIKYGVEQVNRRCKVIQNDWDRIKSLCNIELPNEPLPDDKIIKIVCTDIFDFTTLKYDGIRITDESTLLKFFVNPIVKVYSGLNRNNPICHQRIWKGSSPTVDEFFSYLDKPVTVEFIKQCMKEEVKLYPCYKGDHPIAILDQIIAEDPFKKEISETIRKSSKTGRNERCPCGSGRKYKYCCAKSN
ncbi:SEC-C motif-containing protein [Ruminiclostridium sufflavum DSM 19573]|uniref:SEC-C motif-containing protein n=1 Tax=Ruminiclostridium sufflavum DSM 19573 TaxID=1121337 RepID=A0A318XFF4_9FIRM|nr:SEC-C metal-binding domain-containing protein [Ruminiclostridium sufflavum]PYG84288.1 SEC-C motif-containing protein [Ruminiclostridium sufflavum DSM 19573]